MRRAGFQPPKLGPHTLRHTFGMQYVLKGGDLFSLQTIMGHTNINTTKLYVSMTVELAAMQLEKFTPTNDYFLSGLPTWQRLIASDLEQKRIEQSPVLAPVAAPPRPAIDDSRAPTDAKAPARASLLNIRLTYSDLDC